MSWKRVGIIVFSVMGLMVFRAGVALAATCPDLSGTDITISTSCELPAGAYTYSGTLTIPSGVTVTAMTDNSSVGVTITADQVDIEGILTADGQVTTANVGPGASGTWTRSHGGIGYDEANGGPVYGSVTQPSEIGSSTIWGGVAGGAIKLVVSGTATINGSVSASTDGGGYAGSGGSVWIQTGTLAGSGSIAANGGNGYYSGGGGGRISITYTTDASTIISGSHVSAHGGCPSSYSMCSGAGTIYVKDNANALGSVLIDNSGVTNPGWPVAPTEQVANVSDQFSSMILKGPANYRLKTGSTLTVGTLASGDAAQHQVTIPSGNTLSLTDTSIGAVPLLSNTVSLINVDVYGTLTSVANLTWQNGTLALKSGYAVNGLSNLTIGSGATVSMTGLSPLPLTTLTILSGGTLTHETNAATRSHIVYVTATNVDIQSGGKIDVSAKGYAMRQGPGATSSGGGGYGGKGGYVSDPNAAGQTYGSQTQPDELGSGGDYQAGGGEVHIEASNSLTVNGQILAKGGEYNYGSGSGGSIWLQTNILAGSGTISANGGPGGSTWDCGGGGGGRIAIYYATNQSSLMSGNVTAAGGPGCNATANGGSENGLNGTVYYGMPSATPILTSISPTHAIIGSGDTQVTLSGSDFTEISIARWNGQNLTTTYVNSTQLTAIIPSMYLSESNTTPVTVYTPAPGGGTSSAQNFSVQEAPPIEVGSVTASAESNGDAVQTMLLVAGSTANLYVHGALTVQGGCQDIAEVEAKIYLTSGNASCTPNGNDCLAASSTQMLSCVPSGNQATAMYQVVIPMPYNAEPTDTGSPLEGTHWISYVTATRSSSETSSIHGGTFDVASMVAIEASGDANYGTVPFNGISPRKVVTFTNKGNRSVNVNVLASGPMVCKVGTIPASRTRVSADAEAGYGDMSPVSSTSTVRIPIALTKRTTGADPIAQAFTQFQMPSRGLAGDCQNTLTFTAVPVN